MRNTILSLIQILLISCHLDLSKYFAFVAEKYSISVLCYGCRSHPGLMFFHIYLMGIYQHHPQIFTLQRCRTFIYVSTKCIRVEAKNGKKNNVDRRRSEMLWKFPAGATDVETKPLIFEPRQPEAGLNEEIAAEEERGHPHCQSQASGPLVVNCPQVKPCCRGATGYKTANTS